MCQVSKTCYNTLIRILTNCLYNRYVLRKIYLFYVAHLVKNIRNNLSNYKRFIFPLFKFDGCKDPINVWRAETKWKLFHDVHEKNALLEANLRKAPKPKTKVLHPGNCKQNFLTALAIFHKTTVAVIQSYFPDESSTVEFLKLFSKWWVISTFKTAFSTITLETQLLIMIRSRHFYELCLNDFKHGKQKEWVQVWQTERIPNCEKFTWTTQINSLLVRTLLCLTWIIKHLLREG